MTNGVGLGTTRLGPDDEQYRAVIDRQFNKRFKASPDYVVRAKSAEQIVAALDDALRENKRVVATSGGHCLEGFVSDPDVRVIIDVSSMRRIYYDRHRNAVGVEAGASVGDAFRVLAERWGVVVPLGEYPGVGIGGHVAGGAFGFLCRQLGLAADYLYGVEVVTVDSDCRPTVLIATRNASDPNRELWWAHTGAGGGNFGIVTRYWFRAPDGVGNDPATFLPAAPESMTAFRAEWSWTDIDRDAFVRLGRNHGEWSERTAAADSPHASLWNLLELHRRQFGKIVIRGVTSDGANANEQIDTFLAALSQGVGKPNEIERSRMSWLDFALNPFPDMFGMPPGGVSAKVKDALLRKRFTDDQLSIAYDHLTRDDVDIMGGMLGLMSYGGRVNAVSRDATASAHREAILDIACNTGWLDRRDEEKNMQWVRAFYHELFQDTGGVPVPGDAYDGALINHPDIDLADPAFNRSTTPWSTLYFGESYERLQRVKAAWDPGNVFRHALSVRRPGDA